MEVELVGDQIHISYSHKYAQTHYTVSQIMWKSRDN